MEWVRKNITVLSFSLALATALCTMTAYIVGSIHGVEQRLTVRMDDIDKRLIRIETVLLIKGILPSELATKEP